MSRRIGEEALKNEVDLLVDFVNTRDVETETDELSDPLALSAWVEAHTDLEGSPTDADPEAHRRLLELRESLRALLRANNGDSLDHVNLSPVREAARRSRYGVSLDHEGRVCIDAENESAAEALGARLLLAVELVQLLGVWPRIKACPAADCEWAFYDTSRNRSRTWCSMEVCGNRAKTRRYRSRNA